MIPKDLNVDNYTLDEVLGDVLPPPHSTYASCRDGAVKTNTQIKTGGLDIFRLSNKDFSSEDHARQFSYIVNPTSQLEQPNFHQGNRKHANDLNQPSTDSYGQYMYFQIDSYPKNVPRTMDKIFQDLEITNFSKPHLHASSLEIQDKLKIVVKQWLKEQDPRNVQTEKKQKAPDVKSSLTTARTTIRPLYRNITQHVQETSRRPGNSRKKSVPASQPVKLVEPIPMAYVPSLLKTSVDNKQNPTSTKQEGKDNVLIKRVTKTYSDISMPGANISPTFKENNAKRIESTERNKGNGLRLSSYATLAPEQTELVAESTISTHTTLNNVEVKERSTINNLTSKATGRNVKIVPTVGAAFLLTSTPSPRVLSNNYKLSKTAITQRSKQRISSNTTAEEPNYSVDSIKGEASFPSISKVQNKSTDIASLHTIKAQQSSLLAILPKRKGINTMAQTDSETLRLLAFIPVISPPVRHSPVPSQKEVKEELHPNHFNRAETNQFKLEFPSYLITKNNTTNSAGRISSDVNAAKGSNVRSETKLINVSAKPASVRDSVPGKPLLLPADKRTVSSHGQANSSTRTNKIIKEAEESKTNTVEKLFVQVIPPFVRLTTTRPLENEWKIPDDHVEIVKSEITSPAVSHFHQRKRKTKKDIPKKLTEHLFGSIQSMGNQKPIHQQKNIHSEYQTYDLDNILSKYHTTGTTVALFDMTEPETTNGAAFNRYSSPKSGRTIKNLFELQHKPFVVQEPIMDKKKYEKALPTSDSFRSFVKSQNNEKLSMENKDTLPIAILELVHQNLTRKPVQKRDKMSRLKTKQVSTKGFKQSTKQQSQHPKFSYFSRLKDETNSSRYVTAFPSTGLPNLFSKRLQHQLGTQTESGRNDIRFSPTEHLNKFTVDQSETKYTSSRIDSASMARKQRHGAREANYKRAPFMQNNRSFGNSSSLKQGINILNHLFYKSLF